VYCWACANAIRFGQVKDSEEWRTKLPTINMSKVNKKWRKRDGRIFFPSTHDITPFNLGECLTTLEHILEAGNEVLIVSKPHLLCIQEICDRFKDYKQQILFRFTIGSPNNMTLQFWEPNAPTFNERHEALTTAFLRGFNTSVSCEPYLDEDITVLVKVMLPLVTDAVWIGPMNKMETRVKFRGISYKEALDDAALWTDEEWNHWNRVKACQKKSDFEVLYARFKDNPKVKWKDAIKKALGLEKPKDIGMDV
jgi:DNA repair photolyase